MQNGQGYEESLEMVSRGVLEEFLEALLQQTRFGNVPWQKSGGLMNYEYEFSGANGLVRLTSVDDDGDYPVRFAVYDPEGNLNTEWETPAEGPEVDAWIDEPTRAIWELVLDKADPVKGLLNELRDMPPF